MRCRYAENRWSCISMVREDNYKFISTGLVSWNENKKEIYGPEHHRLAVFDLTADPYEYNNIINTSKGKEILEWAVKEHKKLKS